MRERRRLTKGTTIALAASIAVASAAVVVVAVMLTGGDDEAELPDDLERPTASLDPAFPADFPLPRDAELVTAFSFGSGASQSFGASWTVDISAREVEVFYGHAAGRWQFVQAVPILGTTAIELRDSQGAFDVVAIDVSERHDATLIGLTLASGVPPEVPPATGPGLSGRPADVLVPAKPEGFPDVLTPPDAEFVDGVRAADGDTVAATLETGMPFDQVVTFYVERVEARAQVQPVVVHEGDETAIAWDSDDGEKGLVVITRAEPVLVKVLVQR